MTSFHFLFLAHKRTPVDSVPWKWAILLLKKPAIWSSRWTLSINTQSGSGSGNANINIAQRRVLLARKKKRIDDDVYCVMLSFKCLDESAVFIVKCDEERMCFSARLIWILLPWARYDVTWLAGSSVTSAGPGKWYAKSPAVPDLSFCLLVRVCIPHFRRSKERKNKHGFSSVAYQSAREELSLFKVRTISGARI